MKPSIDVLGIHAVFQPASVHEASGMAGLALMLTLLEFGVIMRLLLGLIWGEDGAEEDDEPMEGGGPLGRTLNRFRPWRQTGVPPSLVEASTRREVYLAGSCSCGEEDVCSICCETFQDKESLRVLPCQHSFHMACVDKWLARSRLCPLCKANVLSETSQSNRWLG